MKILYYIKNVMVIYILLLVSVLYLTFIQIKLRSKIYELENIKENILTENIFLNATQEVYKNYWETKKVSFKDSEHRNFRYMTEAIKKHNFAVLIFIRSNCGACFDSEVPIWNEFREDVKSKNGIMFAINISDNKDITKRYTQPGLLYFPIINGNKNSSDLRLNRKYDLYAPIVTFIVKPDLTIWKIHVSFFQHPELTQKFCNMFIKSINKGN
ncbi:hypothetical protein ABRY23_14350 [Melioribacteraceae bacterium 4301-Me]|uniref:hypothetical protein n=1 Tax=Pyranulibacter aquaticus TaxID=3163344 RepID=UPI00359BF2EA